ncbi:MAG: DNA-binding protein [Vampirovibrionales bacterium]
MKKDLIDSSLERQNVLNNPYAIKELQQVLNLAFGRIFNDQLVFTKKEIADFYEIDDRTMERYVSEHVEELKKNGYKVLKGKELLHFKEALVYATDINVGSIDPKVSQLGIFTFKAFLNIGMLLAESEKARQLRSSILDIVIQVITEKVGKTKTYINQRDEDYLSSAFQEETYRKAFTDALDKYIHPKQTWIYGHFTNKVYQAIFEENAKEYREILSLTPQEKVRDTFYAEVLDLIASFEAGFAERLEEASQSKGHKLTMAEAKALFDKFAKQAVFKPLITKAKTIMASRDYNLRDAFHHKLEAYIHAMPEADYERFLGEKSKALEARMSESLDVYKRLKDR